MPLSIESDFRKLFRSNWSIDVIVAVSNSVLVVVEVVVEVVVVVVVDVEVVVEVLVVVLSRLINKKMLKFY